MKSIRAFFVCAAVALLCAPVSLMAQAPLDPAFLYQGQLKQTGISVNDLADFRFRLFDSPVGGSQVGATVFKLGENVVNGLFTVELDFGVFPFDGDDRWLEIAVRVPAGGGIYYLLSPRQPLDATPYALQTRGLYVDEFLNVGVGITVPMEKLHVNGNFRVNGMFYMYDGTDQLLGSYPSSQGIYLDTDNIVTGNAVYAWGTSNVDGAGVLHLRSRDGVNGVEIDGDGDDLDNGITAGLIEVRSFGTGGIGGQLYVRNNDGFARISMLGGGSSDGGTFEMLNGVAGRTILLDGEAGTGADIQMFNDTGVMTIDVDSQNSDAGQIGVTNGLSSTYRIELDGDGAADDGGEIEAFAADGSTTIHIDAQEADNAGAIEVRNDLSSTRVYIDGMDLGGGLIDIRQDDGTSGILLRAEEFGGNGSVLEMFAEDGAEVVELDSGFASASGVNFFLDGDYQATGTKSAAVTLDSGEQRLMYCTESSELWFEEVGSGQMQNGFAEIKLDPIFAQTVTINEQHPIRVLITLTDNCNGVYVKKYADRFTVHELMDGTSNATFDYKVICKRKGFEDQRMALFVRPANDGPDQPVDQSRHIPTEGLGDPTDGAGELEEEQNVVPQRRAPSSGQSNELRPESAPGQAVGK